MLFGSVRAVDNVDPSAKLIAYVNSSHRY